VANAVVMNPSPREIPVSWSIRPCIRQISQRLKSKFPLNYRRENMARNREFPVAGDGNECAIWRIKLQCRIGASSGGAAWVGDLNQPATGKLSARTWNLDLRKKLRPRSGRRVLMGLLCDNMTQPRVRFWIDFFAKVDRRQKIWHYTQMRWNYRVSEIELGFLT
jgi:hypothetical protein